MAYSDDFFGHELRAGGYNAMRPQPLPVHRRYGSCAENGVTMLLLVDDDPEFLETAQKRLTTSFRAILFALNGDHARSLMQTVGTEFAVAMIDLSLRTENGFKLIREFHERYPALPVIAISGVHSRDVLESAKVFGATATLQKPLSPVWLDTIQRLRSEPKF